MRIYKGAFIPQSDSSSLAPQQQDGDRSGGVLQVFGREVIASTKQSRWIERAFFYWRRHGFPYPELTDGEKENEFRHLEHLRPTDVIRAQDIQPSTVGLRLANYFHPQMWNVPVRRHLRSPLDHFRDDNTLIKLLGRAARFWPNRRCWNAQCLRSALRIYAGGRVSNFRPTAARAIIAKYSRPGEVVLDFSAGFGGRLLGCLTLQRRYFGIDPAEAQIRGLTNMVKGLRDLSRSEVAIVQGCAENVMLGLPSNSVDLVFSSPPYFDVEKYSEEDTQSYRRYPGYTTWKEQFLWPIISASQRVLRRGGHLILNVADTQRHAVQTDIQGMIGGLLRTQDVLRLLMHARPVQRAAGIAAYRWEPVFVFKKIA